MTNSRSPLTRRSFLHRLLAAGVVTAGGATAAGCGLLSSGGGGGAAAGNAPVLSQDRRTGSGIGPAEEPAGRMVSDAVDGRILVIVDLQGGNDGLSTLIPYGSGRYYDLRPELAVPQSDVLSIDDQVGLHPSLQRLHRRGVMAVEGVGPIDGDLSHFDMAARWQRGDVDGSNANARTGFLARLIDAVDDGSPLVGVSTSGTSPYLTNAVAATLSLADVDQLWMLEETDWEEMAVFQTQLARFDDRPAGPVADGYGRLLDLAGRLDVADEEIDWETPMLAEGGDIGHQLHLAADLIAADVGTRVVYAATGDYDTHSEHRWRQAENLNQIDASIDGFLDRAEVLGFADRVVVATVSEFGRRVPENGSGLDHGSASTMLVAGGGLSGLGGERPDLSDLDDDENLRTTVGFDRYLASLAQEWLGVEAASVLTGDPQPLGLF